MNDGLLRVAFCRPVYFTTLLLGSLVVTLGCGGDKPKGAPDAATPSIEAACDDGRDNDRDGKSDCEDIDCQSPGGQCVLAPPLDRTVATTVAESAAYLYQGDNPLQREADAKTFDAQRIALMRGRVVDVKQAPLAGVRIAVKDHPEYGYTYSRGDGYFDLAVNGGDTLVVEFALEGHLPLQRSVRPRWQLYLSLPDVGLVHSATNATHIATESDATQLIVGDKQEGELGTRQPFVVIDPDTQARVQLRNDDGGAAGPGGNTGGAAGPGGGNGDVDSDAQKLSSFTVTATEYPVTEGNAFAPGSSSSLGGLAYGLEFAVKEAVEAAAEHVVFSKPVSLYVENLGAMPVGRPLVVRHYDRESGQWEPGIRGQVIELLDVVGGSASIDSDGDGVPDSDATLTGLGITESDRIELAKRYEAGQRLWHAELSHFSGHELEAQGTPPLGAVPPLGRGIVTKPFEHPTRIHGVLVEPQASTYGEPITGTPFNLHYQANRTLSYGAGLALEIPLIGDVVPPNLKAVISRVTIANRIYEQRFTQLGPDLRHNVAWDGRDAAGRTLQGQQVAEVTIQYVYPDAEGGNAEAILPVSFDVALGAWDARAFGLGGFSIDAHHSYDPARQILYFGNGEQRSAENLALAIQSASRVEGFDLGTPDSLVVAADGSLVFTDDQQDSFNFGRILKIGPGGAPQVMFGEGASGAAANVRLTQPQGVVVAKDGSLIVADIFDNAIVRIRSDGSLETLVSGDKASAPLVEHALNRPDGMALGPHDELYFVDADQVYRLEAGKLSVVAGGGSETTDGIDATKALLSTPSGLAVDQLGNLYVSERNGHRVRKISTAGVITTIAGTRTAGFGGDGDVAALAQLNDPHGLALDPEGRLYIVDQGNGRIRRVSADGIIQTVIGGGESDLASSNLAVNVRLEAPDGIAAGPDGSLYIAQKKSVIRAYVGLPKLERTDHLIPSADGGTLYHFDRQGRHLATIDAITGVTHYTFKYDARGLLEKILDRHQNETKLERDATGRATAIVGPYGQRSEFGINEKGDVASITDALKRTTTITWNEGDLVARVERPKQKAMLWDYDVTGRLLSVSDPTGYASTLNRTNIVNGWQVDVTTAAGTTSYSAQQQGGTWTKTVIAADKTKTILIDTGASLDQRASDGTKFQRKFTADVNFGAQVQRPYLDTVTLPSGKSLATEWGYQNTFADGGNVLNLKSFKQWSETNGRYSEAEYVRANQRLTQTSPLGLKTEVTLNALGQPISLRAAGIPETAWQYDSRGRPTTMTQSTTKEARSDSVGYDANGFVSSHQNALAQVTSFERDVMGRLELLRAPDQAETRWKLDEADNVTSLTPPGREPHLFSYYVGSNLLKSTTPPATASGSSGSGNGAVHFEYDDLSKYESRLKKITRADGRSIEFGYDNLGRLASQKLGAATIGFNYSAGHLTRIHRSDSVTIDQSFDGPLWMGSKWSGAVAGDVKATYDENFWLSSLTVNGASTVNYEYDDDGRLIAANATVGGVSFQRDVATGRISGIKVGNITSQQLYSDFGELSQLAVNVSGATLFEQRIVARDLLGRITHLTETVQGVSHEVTYEYDVAGRLWKQTRDGVTTTYGYDENGNRTTVQVGTEPAIEASYDAQDRIESYGNQKYEHDAHGDLKTRSDGTKSVALNYDELGNLMKAVLSDGAASKSVEYLVDGLGRRVARRVNGQFDRKWLYRDSLRPIAEIDAAGVFTHFVYSANDELSGAPVAMIRGGVFYRIVKDHHGSVRLVVNAQTGTVAQSIEYDAYGRVLSEVGAGFQPFGYAGGLYDADTKLVRFGARDYDPGMGRWTNKDPIGFAGQQGNLYVYVDGEPVNRGDPSGLDVYLCTAPLHALGPVWGPRLYNPSWYNWFYHQYLCVKDANGAVTCVGQDRSGAAFAPGSSGRKSKDRWPIAGHGSCEHVDHSSCVDSCVLRTGCSLKRPWYAVGPHGTDCQEWADETLARCQSECTPAAGPGTGAEGASSR